MTVEPVGLAATLEDVRDWQDGLADVLCWFNGYRAGLEGSDRTANFPDLGRVRDLSSALQGIMKRQESILRSALKDSRVQIKVGVPTDMPF